jgi:acetyl esterase/lipase
MAERSAKPPWKQFPPLISPKERVTTAGYVFISADYRLMPSANLHDITDDIKDLFSFLSLESSTFEVDAGGDLAHFGVDTASIAVAGSSAGGTCAYLAAIHASPKPKAVLGLYSMCGNLFVSSIPVNFLYQS